MKNGLESSRCCPSREKRDGHTKMLENWSTPCCGFLKQARHGVRYLVFCIRHIVESFRNYFVVLQINIKTYIIISVFYRTLDPKTSRWLSTNLAAGEYIPSAPINDEVRKANANLPGMGGVYNIINMHMYGYAANNPVKYTDPDGRRIVPIVGAATQQKTGSSTRTHFINGRKRKKKKKSDILK